MGQSDALSLHVGESGADGIGCCRLPHRRDWAGTASHKQRGQVMQTPVWQFWTDWIVKALGTLATFLAVFVA